MRKIGESGSSDSRIGVAFVIHGLLDGAHGLATAAGVPTVESDIQATFLPVYGGVGDSTKVAVDKLSEQASDLLGQGEETEALKILSRVVEMDAQAAASAKLDLILGGKTIGQVSLDAGRRAVSVLVHPDRLKAANCYAVIEFAGDVILPDARRKLVPVEEASYLLAEFEDLPDGRFALGLEFPDF